MSEATQTMTQAPQWREVLLVLNDGANAWQTPGEIASRLNHDVEETTDLLAALDVSGLVLVREPDDRDGPVVALSARGAERLRQADGPRERRNGSDYRSSRPRISATAAPSVAS